MAASFDEALAAENANPPPEKTDTPPLAEKKVEKQPAAKAEVKSEFPDEILLGKKDEKPSEDEDDKVLKERPTGQIKHDHFDRLQQAANRKVEAKAAEALALKTELETLRVKASAPDEQTTKTLAELRTEADKYKEELSKVAFERHDPGYQKVIKQQDAFRSLAMEAAKAAGSDEKVVEAAFRIGGVRGLALIRDSDIDVDTKSYINSQLGQHDQKELERQEMVAGSKAALEQEAQRAAVQRTQREAHFQKIETEATERVRKEMETKLPSLQKVEGNEEWNTKVVEATHRRAKEILDFRSDDPAVVAEFASRNAYLQANAEVVDRMNTVYREKINALIKENAALKGGSPHINGNGNQTKSGRDTSKLSPEDQLKASFEDAMANPANRA